MTLAYTGKLCTPGMVPLARPARHCVGHQAVKSETREQQSQPAKKAGDGGEQPLPQQRLCGLLPQRFCEEDG